MVKRIGWFDAFRENGGPTWYGENRTPVVTDTTTVGIIAVFVIFLLAFLIILPGIRKERWSSFCSVFLTLIIGSLILVCMHHPCWHVGEVRVYAAYRAFSPERLDAVLGVRVGLKFVNITLIDEARPSSDDETINSHHSFDVDEQLATTVVSATSHHHGLHYNERFLFTEVKSMEKELQNALHKGLPYPILRVIEYLSVDRAGFIWGRQYRVAGYYTYCLLWLCLALWMLQVAMLCLVPQYFTRMVVSVGATLLAADLCYALYTPANMLIRFPADHSRHAFLRLRLGWCFWSTLAAGCICFVCGLAVRLLEMKSLYRFATFLQTDFDEVASSSPHGGRGPRAPVDHSADVNGRRRTTSNVTNTASVYPSPEPSPVLEHRKLSSSSQTAGGGHVGQGPSSSAKMASTFNRLRPDSAALPPSPQSCSSPMELANLPQQHQQSSRFTFSDDDIAPLAGGGSTTTIDLPMSTASASSSVNGVHVLKISDCAVAPPLRDQASTSREHYPSTKRDESRSFHSPPPMSPASQQRFRSMPSIAKRDADRETSAL